MPQDCVGLLGEFGNRIMPGEMHDPRSLILVDETDSVALQEHFLVPESQHRF